MNIFKLLKRKINYQKLFPEEICELKLLGYSEEQVETIFFQSIDIKDLKNLTIDEMEEIHQTLVRHIQFAKQLRRKQGYR